MLQWNTFSFGRAEGRVRQAEAARDEMLAQYDAAVLTALGNAEDALSRFRHRRTMVASLARAQASPEKSATLMQQRYAAGTTTQIDLLDSERQRVAAQQGPSAATAGLTSNDIGLQKALGLGREENRKPEPLTK